MALSNLLTTSSGSALNLPEAMTHYAPSTSTTTLLNNESGAENSSEPSNMDDECSLDQNQPHQDEEEPAQAKASINHFLGQLTTLSELLQQNRSPKKSSLSSSGGEQPLDLSVANLPRDSSSPKSSSAQTNGKLFKAKKRGETAWKRTYSEEDLANALRKIQSGILGTRRAANLYQIPRSTLRNKVHKLSMEQRLSRRAAQVNKESDSACTSASPSPPAESSIEEPGSDLLRKLTSQLPFIKKEDDEDDDIDTVKPEHSNLLAAQLNAAPLNAPELDSSSVVNPFVPAMGSQLEELLSVETNSNTASNTDISPNPLMQQFVANLQKFILLKNQQDRLNESSTKLAQLELLTRSGVPLSYALSVLENGLFNDANIETVRPSSPAASVTSRVEEITSPEEPKLAETLANTPAMNLISMVLNSIGIGKNSQFPSASPSSFAQSSSLLAQLNSLPQTEQFDLINQVNRTTNYASIPLNNAISQMIDLNGLANPLNFDTQTNVLPEAATLDAVTQSALQRLQPLAYGLVRPLSTSTVSADSSGTSSVTSVSKADASATFNSEPLTRTSSNASDASRKRPKRGRYRNYNRDDLDKAVKAVQRGEMSVHRAGTHFGVPHSTLEYKVKERHLLRPKKRVPRNSTSSTDDCKSVVSNSGGDPPVCIGPIGVLGNMASSEIRSNTNVPRLQQALTGNIFDRTLNSAPDSVLACRTSTENSEGMEARLSPKSQSSSNLHAQRSSLINSPSNQRPGNFFEDLLQSFPKKINKTDEKNE